MRSWGLSFAEWFEKYMFVLIPGSLLLGFMLSSVMLPYVSYIPYLFGYITFIMALGCGRTHLKQVVMRPAPILLTLVLAHVLAPIFAYGLGSMLFGMDSDYTIGLVLFAIIPLGVSSVLWVGQSHGNVTLMLAMVVLDSALSPFVVPGLIEVFFGTSIKFDSLGLMKDLMIIVVVPTLVGVGLHDLSAGQLKQQLAPVAVPLSKIAFSLVVMLNAAAIAPQVSKLKHDMVIVIPAIIAVVGLYYALGYFGSYALRRPLREIRVTVAYASGMRNISLGMVLAMSYFSPKASVPVVLGIMVQQPIATIFHAVVKKWVPLEPKGDMTATSAGKNGSFKIG
ncbi:bile acid:sodium symporter family protein [Paenibacillus pini]|uniref:Bile acid sodium symporter n=1 Tax=Paenibacillus pini JCM 16418 TaxID=1236976 RepID=W7YCZ2_9BACL|nr:bile acid:sodium symporter [Paenibacillus pini]GAF06332.1 bile acid sodium symporter [Paenibacillus pini JCM 16418]